MSNTYVKSLETRIGLLEHMVNEIGFNAKTSKRKRFPKKTQTVAWSAMHRALCVDTLDPWKENRIRFYHPVFDDPNTPVLSLPFAWPVSSQGGFDDCGCNWVPPAGSTVVLFFENGHRGTPYYFGTVWQRDRGAGGSGFGFPVPEYSAVSAGHRGGYLVGPDDESQVFPQWNTESYNNFDTDSVDDFVHDTNAQQRMCYPNIYGWKTPEKHSIKLVDGNAKCDRRWKRIEIQSGCGNWMIFKDDHLHYGGQWAHPSCASAYAAGPSNSQDVSLCSTGSGDIFTDPQGNPIENGSPCQGKTSSSNIIGGHPSTPNDPPDGGTQYVNSQGGSNPYFKHQNECRPVAGPGTPQNNKIDLPQSGIQFLSISGHTMVMDDSVEEPQGKPTWERSLQAFDFGCNNKYLGVLYLKSATGHSFAMSDVEEDTGLRGDQNYIQLKSAAGNSIELNDHTVGQGGTATSTCQPCPPNYAGPLRGIHLESTSMHQINMVDYMNQQCSPCRKEGGDPTAAATKAFVQIISGYGLEMRFNDDNSQQQTQNQWIQITNPQCAQNSADDQCNTTRGPHFMRFQAQPQGTPGIVLLRAGGHAIRTTYDMDIVLVGDTQNNPSDKFTYVSRMRISATEKTDFRYAGDYHIFFAEQQIFLMAGRDCPPKPATKTTPAGKCNGPCLYPVVVGRCPWVCPLTGTIHWTEKALSERVFASAKNINCTTGEVIIPDGQPYPCTENTTTTSNTTSSGSGAGGAGGNVTTTTTTNIPRPTDEGGAAGGPPIRGPFSG